MQDVHLGLLVALLPALAGHGKSANTKASTSAVHNIISGHDSGNSGKISDLFCSWRTPVVFK